MQRRTEMDDMEDPCDICGDFGYGELIVSCSSCPNREHIYCAAQPCLEVPDYWICNLCQLSDHANLSTSHLQEESIGMVTSLSIREVPRTFRVEAHPKRKRIAKPSKVVCLTTEEVMKLSSRERMTSSRSHMCLKPKVAASRLRQNPLKSRVSASKSTVRAKDNQQLVSSGCQHPLKKRISNLVSPFNQQCETSVAKELKDGMKSISGKKVLVQQLEKQNGEGQSMDTDGLSFERKAPIQGKEEFMKSASPISPSRNSQPITKSGMEAIDVQFEAHLSAFSLNILVNESCSIGGDNDAVAEYGYSFEETRFLHYILPKLNVYWPYLPALSATWRGRLKFPGDRSCSFRVHPPYSFHRKAYELFLHMPLEIHMEPIPLTYILTDIFKNEGPDIGDVGLYFYPANTVDRYVTKYSALVQLMVSQDYAMRGTVNGAELLLFTSKELHVDSHLFIVGLQSEYFLWGIFHGGKTTFDRESLHEETNVHPPLFVGKYLTNGHPNGEKSKAIDRITRSDDLSRNSSKGAITSREEGTIGEIALPGTDFAGSFQEHAHDVAVDHGAANYPSLPFVENIRCLAFNVDIEDTCSERINSSSEVETLKQVNQQVKLEVQDTALDKHDAIERIPKLLPKMEKPDKKFGLPELGTSFSNQVKLNTSGIYRGITGSAGAGGTVHTSSGKWLFGYSLRLGKWSSLGADLWAIFQGLKLVWDRGYRQVLMLSDSHTALKCLHMAPQANDPHIDLIQGCRDLMLRDWDCAIDHISQEKNAAAAWLADHSEFYPLGLTELDDPPPELACILKNQDNGISPLSHSFGPGLLRLKSTSRNH